MKKFLVVLALVVMGCSSSDKQTIDLKKKIEPVLMNYVQKEFLDSSDHIDSVVIDKIDTVTQRKMLEISHAISLDEFDEFEKKYQQDLKILKYHSYLDNLVGKGHDYVSIQQAKKVLENGLNMQKYQIAMHIIDSLIEICDSTNFLHYRVLYNVKYSNKNNIQDEFKNWESIVTKDFKMKRKNYLFHEIFDTIKTLKLTKEEIEMKAYIEKY